MIICCKPHSLIAHQVEDLSRNEVMSENFVNCNFEFIYDTLAYCNLAAVLHILFSTSNNLQLDQMKNIVVSLKRNHV